MPTSAQSEMFDLLVVGGGVNGTGIARDAAGRGMRVLLCEQGDLAGATSSASSKLIHGGLRYLERFEFRLVREALHEREVLLRSAPHLIRPLRFVLPHHKGLRPAWVLRAGLLLYDHLGGRRRLPATRSVDLTRDQAGAPLKPAYRRGFEYSDCWVDDARLVALLAVDAAERGAQVLTRTELTGARRDAGIWRAELRHEDGSRRDVSARAMVNAGGPWVDKVLVSLGVGQSHGSVRLIKGSHIVVARLHEGAQCYTLQNADGRVAFAIPYQGDYTLIGTTEEPYEDDPRRVRISHEEITYLCAAVSDYFRRPVRPADVVWSYAGVRPLYDDGQANASAVTRDYRLDLDAQNGAAPLLSVYGGKITTFRRLAEHAMRELGRVNPLPGGSWTAKAILPGGDIADFTRFRAEAGARWPWLGEAALTRMTRAYGTRIERVLGGAKGAGDLGRDFGAALTEREIDYLMREEWARTAEDVLWRRSKLGLHMDAAQRAAVAAYLGEGDQTERSLLAETP